MKTKISHWIMLIALSFLLVGCGEDSASDDKSMGFAKFDTKTPEGTLMASIAALKSNDLRSLIKNSLSEEQYNELVTEFETNKGKDISEADKAQFAQAVTMLTADGAEDQIYAMVSPQLEQARAMLPFMLAMGKDQMLQGIRENQMLPEEQRETAVQVAGAVVDWVGENDVLSEEVTKSAIAAVVVTAKQLNMTSLDEVQSMSFDQALEKGAIVMGGAKNVMGAYGISLDDILDSIEVNDVQTNGDSADMNISFTVFGEEIKQAVKMLKKDGRWLSEG